MTGLVDEAKSRAAHAAGRTAIAAVAAAFFVAGLGFVTGAAWIVLAEFRDPLFAALILAAVYFGLGCLGVAFFLATRNSDYGGSHGQPQPRGARAATLPPIAEAFVFGLNAGMEADRRKNGACQPSGPSQGGAHPW